MTFWKYFRKVTKSFVPLYNSTTKSESIAHSESLQFTYLRAFFHVTLECLHDKLHALYRY